MSGRRCPLCTLCHSPHCYAVPKATRWDVEPLIQRVGVGRATELFGDELRKARRAGLTDNKADRWAVRAGLHPEEVWPGWCEKALTPLDAIHVDEGRRSAWLWREQVAS